MNKEEKLEYVKEHLLDDAVASIEAHRRYWNPSISRTLTCETVGSGLAFCLLGKPGLDKQTARPDPKASRMGLVVKFSGMSQWRDSYVHPIQQ